MKKIRPFLLLALLLIVSQASYAHALWIEANAQAQKGQKQEVKIYYGEFATGEIEPVSKWYSDVKSFSLWLTGPDQKRSLVMVSAKDDHYVAAFTPEKDGVYYLSVSHEAEALAEKTKYIFSSIATVYVGKETGGLHQQLENSIKVMTAGKQPILGNATTVQVFMDGNPYANAKVTVTAENGWGKEFTADEKGTITLSPAWKGKYVLEAQHFKKEPGVFKGKDFESTWQGATTVMYVK